MRNVVRVETRGDALVDTCPPQKRSTEYRADVCNLTQPAAHSTQLLAPEDLNFEIHRCPPHAVPGFLLVFCPALGSRPPRAAGECTIDCSAVCVFLSYLAEAC